MKTIYLRTSTAKQDGRRFNISQLQKEYDKIFFDKGISGKIDFEQRPEAAKLMKLIKENKVSSITIPELSRLGRDRMDVQITLQKIEKLGPKTNIQILDIGVQRLDLNGKESIGYKMIIPMMATMAEFHRETILETTRQGLKAYVQNGGKLGRPKGRIEKRKNFLNKPKIKQVSKMLNMKKSYRDIQARTKCGAATIAKVKKLMK